MTPVNKQAIAAAFAGPRAAIRSTMNSSVRARRVCLLYSTRPGSLRCWTPGVGRVPIADTGVRPAAR